MKKVPNNNKPKGIIVIVVRTIEGLVQFISESKTNFNIGGFLYIVGWNCLREMGIDPAKEGLVAPFSDGIKKVAKEFGLNIIVVDNDDTHPGKTHFRDLIDGYAPSITKLYPINEPNNLSTRVISKFFVNPVDVENQKTITELLM